MKNNKDSESITAIVAIMITIRVLVMIIATEVMNEVMLYSFKLF